MTSTLSTQDKVARLLTFALGEPYGDGEIVTDVVTGYAEPGYRSLLADEDPVIVFGDWNPKRWPRDGDQPLTAAESLPSRLARSLERVGAEIEWLDEWTTCSDCLRAVRTQPDSYSWKPSYAITDDGFFCHECMAGWGEDALATYVNNPRECVTWCEPEHVESFGYVKWEPDDPHTYENGWHPGQTDDPTQIYGAILERHPDAEVVFFLDESSQFYIRFSAYVRVAAP